MSDAFFHTNFKCMSKNAKLKISAKILAVHFCDKVKLEDLFLGFCYLDIVILL